MKLSVATAAIAFAASALALGNQLADDPAGKPTDNKDGDSSPKAGLPSGLPDLSSLTSGGLGSLPPLSAEQKEQAKKVFAYFYPECSVSQIQ
jgi:hypothetical protein